MIKLSLSGWSNMSSSQASSWKLLLNNSMKQHFLTFMLSWILIFYDAWGSTIWMTTSRLLRICLAVPRKIASLKTAIHTVLLGFLYIGLSKWKSSPKQKSKSKWFFNQHLDTVKIVVLSNCSTWFPSTNPKFIASQVASNAECNFGPWIL